MKRISFACVFTGLCLALAGNAQAAEINFTNFEVGASGLFQNSGSSGTAMVRYAPNMLIRDDVRLGLSVDFAPHKFNDETKFNAVNVLLDAEYIPSAEWAVGVSVGAESWDCSGCGSKTVVGLLGRKTVDYSLSAVKIQSAFVQVLTVETDPKTTGAIAGVQIQF